MLEFHEFLTMVVGISFYRANPQYGMRKGKDQKNADQFGEEVPLPGCLTAMLNEKVIPNARTETYAKEFKENTLVMPEVQAALGEHLEGLTTFYEMVSAGRPGLELDQWIGVLESKLLFSNLTIDGFPVRLTEPQARAAWIAACADPSLGCTPDEMPVCIARVGFDKYRHVTPLSAGAKVGGFLSNLMGEDDEEDIVLAATGGRNDEE